jgi:hypothetical protein
MNMSAVDETARSAPAWLWAAGAVGTAWNVYGLYQYVGTFTPSGQAAMTAGMSAAQAELYLSLPAWISVVFAIGVFGGLAGSIALLLRRRIALPIFAASLAGYVLLFAGDTYYGVFEAIPSQLAILAVVVLIAAALLAAAWQAGRRGLLR